MRVVRRLRLGGLPRSLAADGRSLWVAATGGGSASSARVSGVTPLSASRCDPVVGGGGRADVLVVSDLPVQGNASLGATQMAQAIALTLREHGFRAGRLRMASLTSSVRRRASGHRLPRPGDVRHRPRVQPPLTMSRQIGTWDFRLRRSRCSRGSTAHGVALCRWSRR